MSRTLFLLVAATSRRQHRSAAAMMRFPRRSNDHRRLRRRISIALVMACFAPLMLGVGAQAQMFTRQFGNRGLGLNAEDMQRLNAATAKLTEATPVGTTQEWTNSESGNRGTVQLVDNHAMNGMPCLKVRHVIKLRGVADPQVYVFERCRLPDGTWKLF